MKISTIGLFSNNVIKYAHVDIIKTITKDDDFNFEFLHKIKNTIGAFEYFYDIDGRFIF